MKILSSVAVIGLIVGSLGCGPAEVVRSTRWNVHDRMVSVDDAEPATPEAAEIVRGEPYQVRVSLSPKQPADAKPQDGEWVFYKDGRLFGRSEADDIVFSQAATILALDAHSSSKKAGSYKYELYLDDELVTEVPIEILPPPRFQPAIEH